MSKKKVTRIIINGVPHKLVCIDESIYENVDDVCVYCSLHDECRRKGEDDEDLDPRFLCGMNGELPNTLFEIETDCLDKTLRELLNEYIEK